MDRRFPGNVALLLAGIAIGVTAARLSGSRAQRVPSDADRFTPVPATPVSVEAIPTLLESPGTLKVDADLMTTLGRMSPEEFRAFGRSTRTSDSSPVLWPRLKAICKRWIEVDLPGAKAALLEMQPASESVPQFLPLLKEVTRADPAWAFATWVPRKPSGNFAEIEVIATCLEVDYALARQAIERLPRERANYLLSASLGDGFIRRDPAAAMDIALAKHGGNELDSAIESVVEEAAKQGRDSLRAALERMPLESRRKLAVVALPSLANETVTDPFEFLDEMLGEEGIAAVQTEIRGMLPGMAARAPESAGKWILKRPPEMQVQMLETFLAQWVRLDGNAATRWAQENEVVHPGLTERTTRMLQLAELKGPLSTGRIDGADYEFDPEAAARFLSTAEPGEMVEELASKTALALTSGDHAYLENWLHQLPAGNVKDEALRTAIHSIAFHDPQRAAATWLETFTKPVLRREAFEAIYEQWVRRDPVEARAWAVQCTAVDPAWRDLYLRLHP